MKTLPATKDQIRLLPGLVDYDGPIAMLEFNVINVSLISQNSGFIMVEIILQRRYFYHLATTYFPTFCLIVITEMLLFINEEHFEAVIMVALTTLLVMYTLHQSISSQLPKTSYMKMIDIWLMFCLTVPFLVFVAEVVSETLRYRRDQKACKATEALNHYDSRGQSLVRKRSLFGRRVSNERSPDKSNTTQSREGLVNEARLKIVINDVDQHQSYVNEKKRRKTNCGKSLANKFLISKRIFIPFLTLIFIAWYIVLAIFI